MANLSLPLFEHAIIHFLLSEKLKDYLGIDDCCQEEHHHHDEPSIMAVATYNTYNIAHTGIHLMGLKGVVDHVRQQNQVIQSMQQELMNLRSCLDSAELLCKSLQSHPEFNALIPGFFQLNALFNNEAEKSAELQEFLTLIKSNTFTGSPSFFSRQGVILRAYVLAKQVNEQLQATLKAIAVIDFYLNATTLYKEFEHTKTPFSFARYSNRTSATLRIHGLWNALIHMQPIDQSVELGIDNPHVAIITGPNKAGKSTGLNAIYLAVILAQSLGITCAHECTLTPFAAIKTGFNMAARVNHGQSLFSASLDFAQAILAKADQSEPIFVAIDELFNSTAFEQGSQIAKQFCQKLSACTNCICLMATHFDALTLLESENQTAFKNYKAEMIRSNEQDLYILEPGISEPSNVLRLVDQENLGH